MTVNLLRLCDPDTYPAPDTDPRLLPGYLRQDSNNELLRCYRTAAVLGMRTLLSPVQRKLLRMYVYKQLSQAEISRCTGLSPSCVSKRINTALETLRIFTTLCADVHNALEKEEVESKYTP